MKLVPLQQIQTRSQTTTNEQLPRENQETEAGPSLPASQPDQKLTWAQKKGLNYLLKKTQQELQKQNKQQTKTNKELIEQHAKADQAITQLAPIVNITNDDDTPITQEDLNKLTLDEKLEIISQALEIIQKSV